MKFFNRVRVLTPTTGTGTLALGSAFSAAFLTLAEAGAADGDETVFVIEEGADFELVRGTVGGSAGTVTRGTVLVSKIGGTVGTSKMDLGGAATVRFTESAEDLNEILASLESIADVLADLGDAAFKDAAVAGGVASLDALGFVPTEQIPATVITNVYEVADEAAMLALADVYPGDIAIRSDENKTYCLGELPADELANWKWLKTPTDLVLSVAGRTGHVTLAKADVGLGNVDNTSDANKPVSSAQQTALNAKASLTGATFTGAIVANFTGAWTVPVGTNAQRPTGIQGMIRFNSTLGGLETFDGEAWVPIAGEDDVTITPFTFDGDGSTVAFDTGVALDSALQVMWFEDGIWQQPNTHFTVSGSVVTRTEAPADGAKIYGLVTTPASLELQAISDSMWEGGPLSLANGGTGESTAEGARAALGAVGSSDVTSIVRLTQAAYDALDPPDATTLYLIEEEA